MNPEIKVYAVWDDEAQVWSATSDEVPGLAIEAGTMEELIKRLEVIIPELLELNGQIPGPEIPFHLYSERVGVARVG
jgi:predicted RNase H-like HicB family nuclease